MSGPPVVPSAGARTPGIFWEQALPVRRPAEPPTGVCALLGVAGDGPLYQPVALRRAEDFRGVFGPPVEGSFLAPAIEGFFACGGATCYAVRVDPQHADWPARGLTALASLDDADLVAVPDLARLPAARRLPEQRAVLEHCAQVGTRFAVLDSFPGGTVADALAQRGGLRSRFGALYFPWIRLADGRAVPPSGHVAGLLAATDAGRGVGAAPGNQELVGVCDLVPPFTSSDLDQLSAAGVNPLRSLPGRGIRIWGDRSLAGPHEQDWTAIGVCRLFLFVARWLAATGVALTFEPNDLPLWVRVRRQLSERLWELWRQGALAGQSPEAAFYVKCDAETNQREVREAGLVVTEIGLAPTVPAEFVVVRLVQQDGRTALA